MVALGPLPPADRSLLADLEAICRERYAAAWAAGAARGETFWINLWQRSGGAAPADLPGIAAVDAWARALALRAFPAPGTVVDGYGLIVNPPGSRAQVWHVDYRLDYGTVFVPLTPLSPANATQWLALPPGVPPARLAPHLADLDAIDLDRLVADLGPVEVRQTIAPPFTALRMGCGTIHRAVANAGGERTMVWISTCRDAATLPVEGAVVDVPGGADGIGG